MFLALSPMSAPFGTKDVDGVHTAGRAGRKVGGQNAREKGHKKAEKVVGKTPGDEDMGDFNDTCGTYLNRLKVKTDQRSQGHPSQSPEQAQGQPLDQEKPCDVTLLITHGPQDGDLPPFLHHHHVQDVVNAEDGHDEDDEDQGVTDDVLNL